MYLVIGRATRDYSEFPLVSPRCITRDPKLALKEARKALKSGLYFLTDVVIYKLDEDQSYSVADSKESDDGPTKIIVYILWKEFIDHVRAEKFFHGFKELCGE